MPPDPHMIRGFWRLRQISQKILSRFKALWRLDSLITKHTQGTGRVRLLIQPLVIIRKKLISMSIISTSLTTQEQPSPRFHVEAWLP